MPNPLKLSQEEFKKSFKIVPRPAVSLLIKDESEKTFFVKRSYNPFKGEWYLPGSFLMKNETIGELIIRIGKEELGIDIDPNTARLVTVLENLTEDKRGHVLDMIFELKFNREEVSKLKPAEEYDFFEKLPEKVYNGHLKLFNSKIWGK